MGKQKNLNKAAKKFARDGKITQKEADRIQSRANKSGANAAVAIAKAAVSNRASIAEQVQASLRLDQNKKNNRVNYTAGITPANDRGIGGHIYGQLNAGAAPITAISGSGVPTYTFKSPRGSSVKTTKGSKDKTTKDKDANTDSNAEKEVLDKNPMNPMTGQWGSSVDDGLGELQAIINAQITANAEQTSLYMGMMQDMMTQMQMAQQTAPQQMASQQMAPQQMAPQGAYAATTYQVAPAAGAQQTLAITPRKKPANTSLSIDAAPTQASGVGVNLAI